MVVMTKKLNGRRNRVSETSLSLWLTIAVCVRHVVAIAVLRQALEAVPTLQVTRQVLDLIT